MKTSCLLFLLIGSGMAFAAEPPAPVYPITRSAAPPAAPAAAVAPTFAPTAIPAPPPANPLQRSAADLEKLVAPIALYPDPLLATVLPASVYPLEIVQAARFVADPNNLAKLDAQPWDASVKAVARVPEAIKKLNEDIAWTMELGEAFLTQDKDVMDAIQSMRGKAQQAGTLQTTPQQIVTVTNMIVEKTVEQQVVVVTNTVVQIQPADSTVVYVPTYNPYTVYYPPPGYVYNPIAPLVSFGIAVGIGAIIHNNCDWHHGGCYHGDVDIDIDRNVNRNVDRNVNGSRANTAGQTSAQKKWQPDQSRLSKSGAPSAANSARSAAARGWSGAGNQAAQRSTPGPSVRPAQPSTQNRAQSPAAAARPTTPSRGVTQPTVRQPSVQQPSVNRPAASPPSANRPASAPNLNRPAAQPSSAFSGVNSGARANNYSNRGAASRGGGGGARGGGGGRR
jgi:hypothetical protein